MIKVSVWLWPLTVITLLWPGLQLDWKSGRSDLISQLEASLLWGVSPGVFLGFFCLFFFFVPQLYPWGSPLLGEIFAYVTVFFFFFFFLIQPLR